MSECVHVIERDSCVFCAPKYQDKDVRDGFCPACIAAAGHRCSTWHVVADDGTAECCACGDSHVYEPGYLVGEQTDE